MQCVVYTSKTLQILVQWEFIVTRFIVTSNFMSKVVDSGYEFDLG